MPFHLHENRLSESLLPRLYCPSISTSTSPSRSRLLLLLLPQRTQTHTRDLDNLESHTGNITLSFALSTETGEKDFVVFVNEVEATVVWYCEKSLPLAFLLCLLHPQWLKSKLSQTTAPVSKLLFCGLHTESSDLLPILNQLHPHTFPDSRIRLFCLDPHFLQHYALGMGGTAEG